jgi:hypothetical protein
MIMDYTKKELNLIWKGLLITIPACVVIGLIKIAFENIFKIIVPNAVIYVLWYVLLLILLLRAYSNSYKRECIVLGKVIPKSNALKRDITKILLAFSGYISVNAMLQLTLYYAILGPMPDFKQQFGNMMILPMIVTCLCLPEMSKRGRTKATKVAG